MVSGAPEGYIRVGLSGLVAAMGRGWRGSLGGCFGWECGESGGVCAGGGVEGRERGVVLTGSGAAKGAAFGGKGERDDPRDRVG